MLSNKPVLPNFIKTVLFSTAAAFSVSAFAEHHGGAEEKIGDLKDMTTTESAVKVDEDTMLEAKSTLLEAEADVDAALVTEEEMAKKAESLTPEN